MNGSVFDFSLSSERPVLELVFDSAVSFGDVWSESGAELGIAKAETENLTVVRSTILFSVCEFLAMLIFYLNECVLRKFYLGFVYYD